MAIQLVDIQFVTQFSLAVTSFLRRMFQLKTLLIHYITYITNSTNVS